MVRPRFLVKRVGIMTVLFKAMQSSDLFDIRSNILLILSHSFFSLLNKNVLKMHMSINIWMANCSFLHFFLMVK